MDRRMGRIRRGNRIKGSWQRTVRKFWFGALRFGSMSLAAAAFFYLSANAREMLRAEENLQALLRDYEAYQQRLESVRTRADIEAAGYTVIENQSFSMNFETFGPRECQVIPALDEKYHRLAIFLADEEGSILWKTDQLETNYCVRGKLEQPTKDISAISFQDVDEDGKKDIVLITSCAAETEEFEREPDEDETGGAPEPDADETGGAPEPNEDETGGAPQPNEDETGGAPQPDENETAGTPESAAGGNTFRMVEGGESGKPYKIGDVLYQGEGSFYRDWRVSDQVNRFGMNKSVDLIVAHARYGYSTEFLYTATTLEELLENGFRVIENLRSRETFERLGELEIVPGTFSIADYSFFMIYLVNEEGYIVRSFQPLGDYDSLYSAKEISCQDLDGDGMKDMAVLARYIYIDPEDRRSVETCCRIYYQRAGGFEEDQGFQTFYRPGELDRLADLVKRIQKYWGWGND